MDRLRLRKRLRLILAVGGILVALTYLGTVVNRARLGWAAYHAEAELENGKAGAEALNADYASSIAEQARRQGLRAKAEQWDEFMESFRQKEMLHRRKERELLTRWW
jgi:hypothetical protein